MKANEEYQSDREVNLEILKWVMTIAKQQTKAKEPTLETLGYVDDDVFMKMLKINRGTASAMRKNGVIRYTKIGGRIFYKLTDIIELLEANFQRN